MGRSYQRTVPPVPEPVHGRVHLVLTTQASGSDRSLLLVSVQLCMRAFQLVLLPWRTFWKLGLLLTTAGVSVSVCCSASSFHVLTQSGRAAQFFFPRLSRTISLPQPGDHILGGSVCQTEKCKCQYQQI